MTGLHSPLSPSALHVVIDMQVLFDSHPEWGCADLRGILPAVQRMATARPDRTVCTRFVPARNAASAPGCWQRYYRHWHGATLEQAGEAAVELVPELAALPLAGIVDKAGYSAYSSADFVPLLDRLRADTLILSGVETDVCVWATVLSAIDDGRRVVIASDAVGSSNRDTHDATLRIAADRFDLQIELATVDEILAAWPIS
ncbi:cysteine hydrolase [Dongia soli]|uniref:Cysteine hydrolase n=1 Tax=Dongia soli TaxID=600628 RepID=A0ABU5EFF2_9PROT|nr:cysteine hydrolase [Dongia soli]MDY0885062.1 cysteine hydrolase [Dongia soli]